MLKFQKYSVVLSLLVLFVSPLSIAGVPGKMICENSGQLTDVALGMGKRAHKRFQSDLTERINKKYSYWEKVQSVKRAIERYHKGAGGYSSSEIARGIVWAADCTGNDFKWFASLIGNESDYCLKRLSTSGGGDSGCGQFTGAAIDTMKLQLKLSSRKRGGIDTASPRATTAMKSMVKSCYSNYSGVVDGSAGKGSARLFYDVMNRSKRGLKRVFRNASALHVDLLASAMFLKFHTARAGGYVLPGKKTRGGVARYNGGGTRGYSSHVAKQKRHIRVNNTCVEDTRTPKVAQQFCAMDEDPKQCMLEFQATYSTGANRIIKM